MTDDEHAERSEHLYRQQRSREVLHALRVQIALAKHLPHATSAEAIADEVNLYLAGWTDALMRGSPELVEELANDIEHLMCDAQLEDAQLLVLSRAVTHMPVLANAGGLDCLLARPAEDVVMASALDAWGVSAKRLGSSAALDQVERTATDTGILRRIQFIRTKGQEEPEFPQP